MNWGRPAFRGPPRPMHPHQANMGFGQGQRELISVPVESHSHSFHMQNPNATAEVIKMRAFNFFKNNLFIFILFYKINYLISFNSSEWFLDFHNFISFFLLIYLFVFFNENICLNLTQL